MACIGLEISTEAAISRKVVLSMFVVRSQNALLFGLLLSLISITGLLLVFLLKGGFDDHCCGLCDEDIG